MASAAADSNEDHDRLLTYRVDKLEQAHKEAVSEIRHSLKSIDRTLQALAGFELQNTQTRQQIAEAQTRMTAIEKELPTLKLVRQWVIAGVIALVAAVGYAGIAELLG